MGVCDSAIKKDIGVNCSDPIMAGLENTGIIINRADIDFGATTFNSTRKNVIETLALKSGKKGYKVIIPGKTPFNGTATSMVAGNFGNTFNNTCGIVVLDNDPDVCADVIDGLANGSYVLVVENKYKGLQKGATAGDAAFQVYGYYQGLQATTLENNKYSDETQGGWNVVLEEQKVPKSALFLYKTSYTVTQAAFNTLTNPAV